MDINQISKIKCEIIDFELTLKSKKKKKKKDTFEKNGYQ